jgi:hypothetical protein
MTTQTNIATLTIPEVINFGEDSNVLNFEEIKKLTEDAKKKAVIERKEASTKIKIALTPEEDKRVVGWVKELEKYIKQWAEQGHSLFMYDCSKLQVHLFEEIALVFKQKNPHFYVETRGGTQMIRVTWDGKNEC